MIAAVTLAASQASATWSIIAVDRGTGQIAIALASCVDVEASEAVQLTAVVVPNKGAATCQAGTDLTNADQTYVFNALKRGEDPATIMDHFKAGSNFPRRQYGMVDTDGRRASATGSQTHVFGSDVTGQIAGTDIVYSIQGNTVTEDVVPDAVRAFVSTKGSILDRAVAALEAGDRAGGDTRCKCPSPSAGDVTTPPCDNKHAQVAYLVMADKNTPVADAPQHQTFDLDIGVSPPGKGAEAIDPSKGESLNPVRTLRLRYDAWRQKQRDVSGVVSK